MGKHKSATRRRIDDDLRCRVGHALEAVRNCQDWYLGLDRYPTNTVVPEKTRLRLRYNLLLAWCRLRARMADWPKGGRIGAAIRHADAFCRRVEVRDSDTADFAAVGWESIRQYGDAAPIPPPQPPQVLDCDEHGRIAMKVVIHGQSGNPPQLGGEQGPLPAWKPTLSELIEDGRRLEKQMEEATEIDPPPCDGDATDEPAWTFGSGYFVYHGQRRWLSGKKFRLLQAFHKAPGHVLTRDFIKNLDGTIVSAGRAYGLICDLNKALVRLLDLSANPIQVADTGNKSAYRLTLS